jgi:hypothetical protein
VVLALLIVLASSGFAVSIRGAGESELVAEQEGELLDEEWNTSASRGNQRPRKTNAELATLPHAFFFTASGTFRDSPDHAPAGHLLPNGLRAPLRC